MSDEDFSEDWELLKSRVPDLPVHWVDRGDGRWHAQIDLDEEHAVFLTGERDKVLRAIDHYQHKYKFRRKIG